MIQSFVEVFVSILLGMWVGALIERSRIIRRMQRGAHAIANTETFPRHTREMAGAVLESLVEVAKK